MFGKNNKRSKKNHKNKNKISLVFNEEDRRNFLTGFRKRKLERKRKAKEKLEQQLKAEKKRLKAEVRDSYKRLVKSYTPVPEVENLLAQEFEDDDVNVRVVSLSTDDISDNSIGANRAHRKSEESDCIDEPDEKPKEELPGMEFEVRPHQGHMAEDSVANGQLRSSKDIKKILRRQATRNIKTSKAFQLKNKLERRKQKKKAFLKKKLQQKGKRNKKSPLKSKT